jgi:hypothetical protein
VTSLGWLLASSASLGLSLGAALLFIPRELWKRWRHRIVDHLDDALRRKVSRFDRRYREFLLGTLRFIDLKGLATVGFYTPELDDVFVDVSLAYRAPHDVPESVLAEPPAEVTDRHSIGHFLDQPQPVVLAVVGVPGSGKTTLLRHTARLVCRERGNRRRTVPILVYLRDHVATIASKPEFALPELVGATLTRYGPDEPPGWFEQRLRDGDCVVLLDGLDEVARLADRRKVADWVERQTKRYPKNDFVITSRPQGYRSAGIDGAAVLQVRSFTDEQVSRFVRRWYLAVEKHSTGASGDDVRLRADSAADDLLERLHGAPGLYDLTVNPLLLTMIANVHRYRGALPGSRADLYGEICQVMLWRRQEAKNLPAELRGDKKEALLRGLAFTMMQRRLRDLPRADVLVELKPTLRRISTKLTEDDFLADVSSNGLLVERESGLYSFAHLTFQEYLAASHIRDKNLVEILVDSVDDVWWRETTLLYAAHSDADPIVRACLSSGGVTALSLAFDHALQGSELSPELRARLDEFLESAFTVDADPERRELMARVLLARHLKQSVRTSSGAAVFPRAITSRIYWLFLKETHGPFPDGTTTITTSRDEPIIGVRARDVSMFAEWVNGTITGSRYRLPTRAEINDPAVVRALGRAPGRSMWLGPSDASGLVELWTPNGTAHPHSIDGRTLTSQVEEDIRRSTPTLTRLLLLRSIVTIRALLRGGEIRSQDAARLRELDHKLDEIFEPVIALDLDHALDRSFYHELDRDRTQNIGLDRALDLTQAVVQSRFARIRDAGSTLDHCLNVAQTLVRTRDLALDPAQDNLIHTLNLANARVRALDAGRGDGDIQHTLDGLIGVALSGALGRALGRGPGTDDWPAEFARAFVERTNIATGSWEISMDMLVGDLRNGYRDLLVLLAKERWAYSVAHRLEQLAIPIITRQVPITSGAATAVRLAALCLAAEADDRKLSQVGDLYRSVAAGVTLLERRADGRAPVTETIILATA